MRFAYYPGCSARSTCAELNAATHRVAARLGLELVQLDSATCTGARELRAIDPSGSMSSTCVFSRWQNAKGCRS